MASHIDQNETTELVKQPTKTNSSDKTPTQLTKEKQNSIKVGYPSSA